MNSWPVAIFFDFDGVIVNSEPLHFAAIRDVLKDEQIELDEDEYYKELIGFDDRGAFGHMFAKHHRVMDAAASHRVLTKKKSMSHQLIESRKYSALPGVDQLVRGLAQHYPLAICSGALREEIEPMLEGVGLREHFPIIVSAEDVTQGKPNPEGYLLTAKLVGERTGVKLLPKDCLIIEDAPSVIRSVTLAGFQTLGVATSYPLSALSHATYAVSNLTPEQVLKQIPALKIGTAK
jgi:HAD superfamily hydrolase (TIGR01509 family)